MSLNIEGMQSNQVYIRDVIEQHNPDIICVQEHWLFNFEQNKMSEIHPLYDATTKSVDDNDPISPKQRPRGYGGVSILWKKDLPVTVMPDGSNRTMVIQIGNAKTLVNTYLPCRGTYSTEDFKDEVDQIAEICFKYQQTDIFLAGDMNVDVHRQEEARSKHFQKFMKRFNLKEAKIIKDPTYIHHGGTSATKIDYILVSHKTPGMNEAEYEILPKATCNTSPHQALLLKIPNQVIKKKPQTEKRPRQFLQWEKADVEMYQEVLRQYLENPGKIISTSKAIEYLTTALQAAAKAAVPIKTIKPNYKPTPWTEDIKRLLEASKEIDAKWKRAGCPEPPDELHAMRKQCRSELRKAQRIQTAIIREETQEAIMKSTFSDTKTFHKLIRQQRKTPQTTTTELEVNGTTYTGDLLPAWTEHFNTLAQPEIGRAHV